MALPISKQYSKCFIPDLNQLCFNRQNKQLRIRTVCNNTLSKISMQSDCYGPAALLRESTDNRNRL